MFEPNYSSADKPFETSDDYYRAVMDVRYSDPTERGRLYRASVNEDLVNSPHILAGSPGLERIRDHWRKIDAEATAETETTQNKKGDK